MTNHAYLLRRMEDDHDFVRGKTLVIDEGQKMVLALEQFSRHQVNLTVLLQHIHRILDSGNQTCFNNACSKICSLKLAI